MKTVKVYSSWIPLCVRSFSLLNHSTATSQFNANVDESSYFSAGKWLNTGYFLLCNDNNNLSGPAARSMNGPSEPPGWCHVFIRVLCESSSSSVVFTCLLWCYRWRWDFSHRNTNVNILLGNLDDTSYISFQQRERLIWNLSMRWIHSS